MANEVHLEILKQGVDVWNKWREENPEITPNLNMADLSGANPRGAKLSETKLSLNPSLACKYSYLLKSDSFWIILRILKCSPFG